MADIQGSPLLKDGSRIEFLKTNSAVPLIEKFGKHFITNRFSYIFILRTKNDL